MASTLTRASKGRCGPCRATCFAEKEQFFYEVTFGWPGMPTQTKLVDVGQEVSVGTQIEVDGNWWVVEQLGPAVGGHRGQVRAKPTLF